MPVVNPEILVWARETAGLSVREAAEKIRLGKTRDATPTDRLEALETGANTPSDAVLANMAKQYRRPLVVFYLDEPPARSDFGPDFRKVRSGDYDSKDKALLDSLIREVRNSQSIVRATLEAEDEAVRLPFVGTLERSPMPSGIAALEEALGRDFNANAYYSKSTVDEAFKLLRTRCEDCGVFVLLKGDLGSHHTAIDIKLFRGFAIADNFAPFIVVNANDSKPAQSFTLLHEMTHLLLGQTCISGYNFETHVEMFCNDAASEWLLPARELERVRVYSDIVEQQDHISEFAKQRNLSGTMVAYRLRRAGRIDPWSFNSLSLGFHEMWKKARKQRRTKAASDAPKINPHTVRRYRIGNNLIKFSRRMLRSGALSTTKTAQVLSVSPSQVEPTLYSA